MPQIMLALLGSCRAGSPQGKRYADGPEQH